MIDTMLHARERWLRAGGRLVAAKDMRVSVGGDIRRLTGLVVELAGWVVGHPLLFSAAGLVFGKNVPAQY